MNEDKKVSIIIPVYNVELYIEKCIESILKQTYKDIEIIIVNDGSSDNSKIICERLQTEDERIKIFNQKNSGVSIARNKGIELSSGKYIMFVDADDYVDHQYVEKMVKIVTNKKMVVCGYTETFEKITEKHFNKNQKIEQYEMMTQKIFIDTEVAGFLWNKIYVTQIIKDNKIMFDEKLKYCEDTLFNVKYLSYIDEMEIIEDCLYNYRMRKSSATWNINSEKSENLIECYNKLDSILLNNNAYSIEYLYYKLNILYKYSIKNIRKITKDEYKKVIKSFKIPIKKKIKLFILRNFNFIYTYYMKRKTKNKLLFE